MYCSAMSDLWRAALCHGLQVFIIFSATRKHVHVFTAEPALRLAATVVKARCLLLATLSSSPFEDYNLFAHSQLTYLSSMRPP